MQAENAASADKFSKEQFAENVLALYRSLLQSQTLETPQL